MINWPVKFVESKYSKWYNNLIHKAQLRGPIQGYKETHHIIPRSFGGDNIKSNVVQLTAREHYIAHALLWKMKFEGIYGSKMAFAFNTFINKMTTKERGVNHTYTISSRMYETFRKHYSQMLKEKYAREGGTWVGRKHSEESKKKIGEKSKLKEFKKGPENPNWGKKRNVPAEEKARRSASIKAQWADPEYKKMMQDKRKAYIATPEGQAQIKAQADTRRGIARDPAVIEKGASKRRGKKAHELFSPIALANIEEGRKNRVYTPEGKIKQIETARKNGKKPKSEEHKRKISESNKKVDRWWTRGENNPNFGKKKSDEERKAMSDRRMGQKLSPEMLAQRRQSLAAKKKSCEHCGKLLDVTNYKRWHGDNCKMLTKINNVG
jgi:hypothetical protein